MMTEKEFEQMAAMLRKKAENVSKAYGMDDMAAEDIAQDVMLKLWAMRNEIEATEKTVHLAAIIAKRLSLNALRTRHTVSLTAYTPQTADTSQEASTQAERLLPDTALSPEEILEEKENERWLQRKLGELPQRQSIILRMRHVERRSLKEIAALIGIEESSVSTLLARARKRLMESLSHSPSRPWER